MSVLSVNERYLLQATKVEPGEIPQRPRTIHLRLTTDTLSKIVERGKEDELQIVDLNKEECSLQIGNEHHLVSRMVEAIPFQIYKNVPKSRGESGKLTWVGDVSTKLTVRPDKAPSTSAFTKLKERREEEAARKSEHRAVLLSTAPATMKSKASSLKLLSKGRSKASISQPQFDMQGKSHPVVSSKALSSAKVGATTEDVRSLKAPPKAAATLQAHNARSLASKDGNGHLSRSESSHSPEDKMRGKDAAPRPGSKSTTKDRLSKAAKGRGLPAKVSGAAAERTVTKGTSKNVRGTSKDDSGLIEQAANHKSKNVSLDYTDSEEEEGEKPRGKPTTLSSIRQGVGRGAIMVKEPWLDIRSAREWHELARRFRRIYEDYKGGLDRVQGEEHKLRKELETAKAEVSVEGRRNSVRTRSASRNSTAQVNVDDEEREEGEAEPGEYTPHIVETTATSYSWRNNGIRSGHGEQADPLSIDELDELVTSVCELEGQLRRMKTALQSTSF